MKYNAIKKMQQVLNLAKSLALKKKEQVLKHLHIFYRLKNYPN